MGAGGAQGLFVCAWGGEGGTCVCVCVHVCVCMCVCVCVCMCMHAF